MQRIAQVVSGLTALILFFGIGARWLLFPESVGAEFGIVFDGPVALNQARGDIGGVFVALGGLCAFGLLRKEPRTLQAVAITIFGVALGRSVGLVVDGFDPLSLAPILVEILMGAMLLVTARGFQAQPQG